MASARAGVSRCETELSAAQLTEACPIAEVLDHVAGKWSIGILVAAAHGPVRSPSSSAPWRASAAGC